MTQRIESLGAVITRHIATGELQVGVFQRTDRRTFRAGLREAFMGGEFQADETPRMVLNREIREKIQIEPIVVEDYGVVNVNEGSATLRRHVFLCEVERDAEPHIDPHKHQGFEWANVEQIHQMTDLVPGTWTILNAVGIY